VSGHRRPPAGGASWSAAVVVALGVFPEFGLVAAGRRLPAGLIFAGTALLWLAGAWRDSWATCWTGRPSAVYTGLVSPAQPEEPKMPNTTPAPLVIPGATAVTITASTIQKRDIVVFRSGRTAYVAEVVYDGSTGSVAQRNVTLRYTDTDAIVTRVTQVGRQTRTVDFHPFYGTKTITIHRPR
jgi:hypothetical protein